MKGFSMADQYHVKLVDDTWIVKGALNDKAYRVLDYKNHAIVIGRRVAQNQGAELIIYDRDGKVQRRIRYS